MAEHPKYQTMNFADENVYSVPAEERLDYWNDIEGHVQQMRSAIEDHPDHNLTDAMDCSLCSEEKGG